MYYNLRMPDGFTPQEYGWEPAPGMPPLAEGHPAFGTWRRKRPGDTYWESLSIFLHDEPTGAIGGCFMPRPCPEQAALPELWDLLRDDPARDPL